MQKKILKKSTKTENKKTAIEFAKKFYEDILLRERNLLPLGSSPIFEKVARELLIEQGQLIERGERSDKLNINDKQKLEKDIYSQIYFIIHMFIPIGFFMVAFMGRKKGHTKRYVMTNILYHSIVLIVLTPLFLIQLPFFQYLFFCCYYVVTHAQRIY